MTTDRATVFWQSWPLALLCTAALGACGPIVAAEEAANTADSSNVVGMTAPEPAAPDAPTPAPDCALEEQLPCTCPDGLAGLTTCESEGGFGDCECDSGGSSGGVESTGGAVSETSATTGWGESGNGGESTGSTTSGAPSRCLPLDQPCPGDVDAYTNADIEAAAACSRIEGSLVIYGGVTDLSPLSCLRELGNQLYMEGVDVPSLAGLSNLQHIEGELELLWTRATVLDLEALESVGYFSLYQNEQLLTLGLPNLDAIHGGLDVHDNSQLSTCEVAALAEHAALPGAVVFYDGNADDGCPSSE